MNGRLKCSVVVSVLLLALAPVSNLLAADFVIRQVTSMGSPSSGLSFTDLLGVVNNRVIFQTNESGVRSLYRTDGTNTELISSPVDIDVDEVAVLNNELFLSNIGPNGRELFATDGFTLRQVADINLGAANSNPNNFMLLNNRLLFKATGGFFNTDGTTVQQFPAGPYALPGSARLGNLFLFGTSSVLKVTDGVSMSTIASPTPDYIIPMTKAGNYVYLFAGSTSERFLYRTDGATSELIPGFAPPPGFGSLFENNGKLGIVFQDNTNKQLIFYSSEGSTPTETLRWSFADLQAPFPNLTGNPLFSDDTRGYFQIGSTGNELLYAYDGSSFSKIGETPDPTGTFVFTELNGRVFVNATGFPYTVKSYELVNGALVPLGVDLDRFFEFQGEIFGTRRPFSASGTLWQLRDGGPLSLGAVIPNAAEDDARFVELNDQLYFYGRSGSNRQLFALVAVPEPSTSLLIFSALIFACHRVRQGARPRTG